MNLNQEEQYQFEIMKLEFKLSRAMDNLRYFMDELSFCRSLAEVEALQNDWEKEFI